MDYYRGDKKKNSLLAQNSLAPCMLGPLLIHKNKTIPTTIPAKPQAHKICPGETVSFTCSWKAKVIIIGNQGTGKTCLALRYVKDCFHPTTITTGFQSLHQHLLVEDQKISLEIWDTAGQERFRSMSLTSVALLVYDVCNAKSFEELINWGDEVRSSCPGIILVVCGNKTDLPGRQIPREIGLEFANRIGAAFAEPLLRAITESTNYFLMLLLSF